MQNIECCAICAWRETCQKKFSISGSSMHCPDFVRDICLKTSEEETKQEKGEKTKDESH